MRGTIGVIAAVVCTVSLQYCMRVHNRAYLINIAWLYMLMVGFPGMILV